MAAQAGNSIRTFSFRPLLFPFLPVAMGVNDHQDKKEESANQQHEDDGLVLPDFGQEIGEIRGHAP